MRALVLGGPQPAPSIMSEFYIGLMSGTSLDGVDAVLADFSPAASSSPRPLEVLAHASEPMPAALGAELLALNTSGENELHRAALAANALVRLYARAVQALLAGANMTQTQVRALGAHGQTLRHCPGAFDGTGYTVQINNGALLAELTGIDVVADFRSRDVAAGGQGAPLVPAFHRAVFGQDGRAVAVVNLGGIGNLTALGADASSLGFDCGPGNALMDHWCRQHTGQSFDRDGAWASGGRVLPALLEAMQAEPYFHLPPPKSTGRDLFNPAWLQAQLQRLPGPPPNPQDVQASLAELTAASCAAAVIAHARDAETVLLCGGGAFNGHVRRRIAALLPDRTVRLTDEAGLGALQVEAAAFAWLAKAFVERRPGNLVSATGAAGPRVLGALYPAR